MSGKNPLSWCASPLRLAGDVAIRPHRNAVGTLWIADHGEIEVTVNGGAGARGAAVLIAPDLMHGVKIHAPRAYCYFSAPLLGDARRVAAAMSPAGAGLWTAPQISRAPGKSSAAPAAAHDAIIASFASTAALDDGDIDRRVYDAVTVLRSSPWHAHDVRNLARAAQLSESRFRHILKSQTGLTLKRLRVWLRLEWALITAQQGSNLTVAAHDAGFSSSAHFSAACREALGLTPTQIVEALKPAASG